MAYQKLPGIYRKESSPAKHQGRIVYEGKATEAKEQSKPERQTSKIGTPTHGTPGSGRTGKHPGKVKTKGIINE